MALKRFISLIITVLLARKGGNRTAAGGHHIENQDRFFADVRCLEGAATLSAQLFEGAQVEALVFETKLAEGGLRQ